MKKITTALITFIFTLIISPLLHPVFAAGGDAASSHHSALLFFALAGILVAAKVLHLIEKVKQPPVVGELIAGIVLGNLTLVGFSFFYNYQHDQIVEFLAELGVIILLFQIGLESNVKELAKVGITSTIVALIGAFVPFLLGTYVAGPLLLPNQSGTTYLFLGASLAATSVGITARIFKDLGKMQTKAARIVLGAAVIDDILGLVMLAVISSLASGAQVTSLSVFLIVAKSVLFLVLSVVLGQILAPQLSRIFAMINTGLGTKFTLAISIGLLFAGLAQYIGLEPIIGAFAAGLVLDPVHFKRFRNPQIVEEIHSHMEGLAPAIKTKINRVLHHHAERSVEDLIEPLALFFVPIFFVLTGMSVNILTLLNPQTIVLSVAITLIAIVGKIVSGVFVKGKDRLIVGLAMVPRGEVGLIFAAIGQGLGVISDQVFSVIVMTVLLTTIIGPALLTSKLRSQVD